MTIRTKAALDALFADNTSGAISPQDLRDFVDSTMGVYGSILVVDGTTTQAVVATTPEQLTEFLSDGISNGTTPAYTSNQITIDNDGVYDVQFNISFEGIAGAVQEFLLYINAAHPSGAPHSMRKTANNDVGFCAFTGQISLSATDVLTVWVESDITGSIKIVESQFLVRRIG